MKKIVDEEDLFREIYEDGFSRNSHPTFQELLVVAKSIRQEKGYGERNIVRELVAFCEARNKFFNYVLTEGMLVRAARAAVQNSSFRKPLFPIDITQKEMNGIRRIRDFSLQKIFFSTILVAKSSGNPRVFSDTKKNISYIISISGERLSYNRFISDISRVAYEGGIFEYILGRHSFYRLSLFDSQGDGIIRISLVSDMNRAGEMYEEFIGGVLRWCEKCGGEFFKLSNNHKLCGECSLERKKEKGRERTRKSRNLNKK